MAERGTINLFIAITLAIGVDDHTMGPGQRWIDEAPGTGPLHMRRLTTGTQPQAYAAAIAAAGTQGQAGQVLRCVLGNHPAIEDKATGTQQHAMPGADQPPLGMGQFHLTQLAAQALGQ
ncbi:hypothetical protein D3C85_1415320 [compost metagenome]